jgi:predicted NBD/HSP70 family sugar kinase
MYQHPSQLRVANVHRAFRMLLARGPCSRAELARRNGLSPVTAGKVVDGMLSEGWVEEVETRSPARGTPLRGLPASDEASVMGRPPRLVALKSSIRFPVVEIGAVASSVRSVSLADAATCDVEQGCADGANQVRFATPRSVASFVSELERARSALGIGRSRAVLVSVPGVLGADGCEIVFSPNLRWSNGKELIPRIGKAFQTRVCAVQEIQALALGHLALVPSEGGSMPDSFVLVDFGDGVGGAVVTGGQLLHGPQPLCGEIGHTGVFGNRRRCGCGAVGCLETLVSRSGVLQSYRTRRRRPKATWSECARHIAAHGVEPWLAPSIDAAATVIAGALNLIGTADLVLTGDVPSLHPEILVAFERRVQEHALIGRFARLTCHLAPRRRTLGLVAAAAARILLPEPSIPVAEAS